MESHWVILEMVKHGIGWAFVSDHVIAHSPAAPDLITPDLQFDDADSPIALEMIWHKQRPCGPAAKWLRERFASTRIDANSSWSSPPPEEGPDVAVLETPARQSARFEGVVPWGIRSLLGGCAAYPVIEAFM